MPSHSKQFQTMEDLSLGLEKRLRLDLIQTELSQQYHFHDRGGVDKRRFP